MHVKSQRNSNGNSRSTKLGRLSLASLFLLTSFSQAGFARPSRMPALQEPQWGKTEVFPDWAYDSGPDMSTPMGKELAAIAAEIPNFPAISEKILNEQKFRPAFGPIPWRMLLKPNSVKILFIGQDGTHIAEAAGRPATAGFGGRAQDLAKYFGVGPSAGFINAYSFTIKGQDGSATVPVVSQFGDKVEARPTRVIDNQLWLMSRDLSSPLVQWRNRLIEWIIRNNSQSLQMIVTFGKPAQDAAAAFVMSRAEKFPVENKGTVVGSMFTADRLKASYVRVPEFKTVPLGGNNEGPVVLGKEGQDLYQEVLGLPNTPFKYDSEELNEIAGKFSDAIEKDPSILNKMVFANSGVAGSGVTHPAQVGGYQIASKMVIAPEFNKNSNPTISLKGLKISEDMGRVDHDLLVVDLPHPTYLTGINNEYLEKLKQNPEIAKLKPPQRPLTASEVVGEKVKVLVPYKARGWKIAADMEIDEDTKKPFINAFDQNLPYKYGRADMGPEFYDFGAPASRMVNVSSAIRLDRNVVVFGGRSDASFQAVKGQEQSCEICQTLVERKNAKPAVLPAEKDLWTMRSRRADLRASFDAGPSAEMAKIMKRTIPASVIKNHPVNQDYGHYRGTFKRPKVLILADQDGWDDLITARALTGTRGQYLQGLMDDLGVKDQYLVIKTAPFSPEESDWGVIFAETMKYRMAVIDEVFKKNRPTLILTDGPWAEREASRLFGQRGVPVISIAKNGTGNDSGIQAAAQAIQSSGLFSGFQAQAPRMSDIPRSHLSFYARVWEGTSGDRVLTSPNPVEATQVFAEIVPLWASDQVLSLSPADEAGVQKLLEKLETNKLRRGKESIPDFLQRVGHQ